MNPSACGFCGLFLPFQIFKVSFNENIPAGLNENCCIPKNQLFIKECFITVKFPTYLPDIKLQGDEVCDLHLLMLAQMFSNGTFGQ